MASSVIKRPVGKAAARKRAGQEVEDLIKALQSFRAVLTEQLKDAAPSPTPRNWWQLQAGRFKDDPTFPEFVAQVQAARKRDG